MYKYQLVAQIAASPLCFPVSVCLNPRAAVLASVAIRTPVLRWKSLLV